MSLSLLFFIDCLLYVVFSIIKMLIFNVNQNGEIYRSMEKRPKKDIYNSEIGSQIVGYHNPLFFIFY